MSDEQKGERLAKRMARAGLCSRREAERWIEDGRVQIDGKKVRPPAPLVTADTMITVDEKPLGAAPKSRMWRYHKPKGLICTSSDPEGRKTIFDDLPKSLPRVLTIGRLDLNSEGLLLLTNDGALKRRLELPANAWTRRYRARVYGRPDPRKLADLAQGVRVDGIDYGPIRAELERQTTSNAWLKMALTEGKNREVRKVLEHLGLAVNRLIRVAYGPFQLGRLPRGAVEEVPAKVLAEQLGEAGPRKIGTAKAKPKPTRPGGKKKSGGKKFRPGKPAAGKGKRGPSGAGKAGPKHAYRRRPS